ncbi:hypothetical protein HH212_17950 [Massilia forsythiae]|uniref:DUF7684 domain-containing protein n=1 Tax=Massilia forsythiae TaxID=2728020 RepID=A0A7Z2ZTM5_9BURK|nr:hypothetical protein [Massilia forsythiae]QJE01678.1 hypothetical protein HH212_17950 [Massilia forsythiae]
MQRTTVDYLHLAPDAGLPAMRDTTPFAAILVADDESAQMWQWEAARWLAASGCRLLMTWGKDCAAWSEAAEEAAEEAASYAEVTPEQVFITTSHEDDDLEEVFWFSKHRAAHPAGPLKRTLILHIADTPRRNELEAAYADA